MKDNQSEIVGLLHSVCYVFVFVCVMVCLCGWLAFVMLLCSCFLFVVSEFQFETVCFRENRCYHQTFLNFTGPPRASADCIDVCVVYVFR